MSEGLKTGSWVLQVNGPQVVMELNKPSAPFKLLHNSFYIIKSLMQPVIWIEDSNPLNNGFIVLTDRQTLCGHR